MKKRSEMTEYEKALDWRDRLSPRWWRVVYAMAGVAAVLWIVGAVIR